MKLGKRFTRLADPFTLHNPRFQDLDDFIMKRTWDCFTETDVRDISIRFKLSVADKWSIMRSSNSRA